MYDIDDKRICNYNKCILDYCTFFTTFAVSENEPKYFFKAYKEKPRQIPHPKPVQNEILVSIIFLVAEILTTSITNCLK